MHLVEEYPIQLSIQTMEIIEEMHVKKRKLIAMAMKMDQTKAVSQS